MQKTLLASRLVNAVKPKVKGSGFDPTLVAFNVLRGLRAGHKKVSGDASEMLPP